MGNANQSEYQVEFAIDSGPQDQVRIKGLSLKKLLPVFKILFQMKDLLLDFGELAAQIFFSCYLFKKNGGHYHNLHS
jgi:hypothetical protein